MERLNLDDYNSDDFNESLKPKLLSSKIRLHLLQQ
jgi:hypothetical protein